MRDTLAIIGALLATFSSLPYLIDIVRRKTKPNIVSWFTWTALTGVASAAAFAAHEPRTALLTLGSSICTGLVVVLGIKYGIAKFSLFDILCQLGAGVGFILWLVLDSPTIGIVIPVFIDFVVLIPTLRHSWFKPGEETWQTFFIGVFAPIFTLFSLAHYNTASLLYPVYILIANAVIVAVVVARRRHFGLVLGRSGV